MFLYIYIYIYIHYLGKGIIGHVHSHDLRRGAAYDAANAKQAATGIATPTVARSIGHSAIAL